jgi:tripartite-type tricarboxylate transporter receptor subunit TctC
MKRFAVYSAALAAVAFSAAVTGPAVADWKPTKPIRIIVPWAAGGSTDQVVRVLAGEMEKSLGQKVVVVNTPGGAGAVGTKAAMDAPKDGYTWTAGAAKDLGTYVVTGSLKTKVQDWHLYLAVANATVVSANPKSDFKTFEDVVKAMKSNPDSVTISTGGLNSASHSAAEAIKQAVGGNYKNITYDGGNPAVLSTVAGETKLTTQLITEQYQMIRAKRLRPLAVMAQEPLTVKGYGEIPPVTNFVKDMPVGAIYFGIWAPKGIPDDVVATMDKVWSTAIKNSKAVQDYADKNGVVVNVAWGDEAQAKVWKSVQVNAWLLQAGGKAAVSPDTVGIPKP